MLNKHYHNYHNLGFDLSDIDGFNYNHLANYYYQNIPTVLQIFNEFNLKPELVVHYIIATRRGTVLQQFLTAILTMPNYKSLIDSIIIKHLRYCRYLESAMLKYLLQFCLDNFNLDYTDQMQNIYDFMVSNSRVSKHSLIMLITKLAQQFNLECAQNYSGLNENSQILVGKILKRVNRNRSRNRNRNRNKNRNRKI